MSTPGEATDADGSGQPAVSNCVSVSNSSSPNYELCNECENSAAAVAVFCVNCKVSLCESCNLFVHNTKSTRSHERMNIDDYLMVKRSLGRDPPTKREMNADDNNKFCIFNPVDFRIHVQPRLALLVRDPNARPSLVSFIGPTGVGKSFLLRLLIQLAKEGGGDMFGAPDDPQSTSAEIPMPLVGAPNDPQSTSSDIHMYPGGQVPTQSQAQPADNSTYPLLYVDSEGRGGAMEPRSTQKMLHLVSKYLPGAVTKKEILEKRFEHVQTSYPRMLYIFSDVLCFVFSGNWREQESILKVLKEWGQLAIAGSENQHRPKLILIFNKVGEKAAGPEFDDFQKTYEKWIRVDKEEIKFRFRDPVVVLIPDADHSHMMVWRRVKMLHEEIHRSTMHIRKIRERTNQLFTRRQLQVYIQLAADTFSDNPNEKFDLYKACMARGPTSAGLKEYIVAFRREVEKASNWRGGNKFESYQISLSVLERRFEWSVLLMLARLNENLPVGPDAKLDEKLRVQLEKAQSDIDGEMPCANCDKLNFTHENFHSRGNERWDGDFISDPSAAAACKLVDLAESALQRARTLDVKEFRERLSAVRQFEHDNYHWLKDFTSYRVCVTCMVALPTEVLSCGHVICGMCAKEEAKVCSPKIVDLTCPVCFSSDVKWYPKDLPTLAGYRILSLDGGGVGGIVELLSLERIMSFFDDMHVEDLFDIIVGTGAGGIIALALTVHATNEQPKRLPEVKELFQELSRQVFSPDMSRIFAKYEYLRYFCQAIGLYDTKYKNDNLLKLLGDHFGEQSLLHSCVGGPHVIVTSCDRDNNLAAAWFTSYNPLVLENKCGDLSEVASIVDTEQATSGRVSDNHLYSAKDVAAATSAAGTYFPAYKAGNRYWVDGGLRLNCPALVAIQEARRMWPNRPASLISLGSGDLRYEGRVKIEDTVWNILRGIKSVVTDAESASRAVIDQLNQGKNQGKQNSSECGLRLNPTIAVPKGEKCELDCVEKMPFLMDATNQYLDKDGSRCVEAAANILFAALFYLDVEMDPDSSKLNLDKLRIRSRASLSERLKSALINSSSKSPSPFSITACDRPDAKSEFFGSGAGGTRAL